MILKYKDLTFDVENFGGVFNICNLYTLLWCIYFAQGGIMLGGTIIAQLALAVNLLITFCLFVRIMFEGRLPFVMKILGLLIIVFTIYGAEPIIYQKEFYVEMTYEILPPFAYLRAIYISIVPIFAYYYFAQKGMLTESSIRWLTILFFLISFAIFRANIIKALEFTSKEDEITNNAGYLFLALIPALTFFKKYPVLQYGLLAVATVMMLVAVKRGAMMIGLITMAWFFIKQYGDMTKKQKLIVTSLVLTFVVAVVIVVIQMFATNDYFFKRFFDFMNGNSSHRDVLYAVFIDHFLNLEDPMKIMFGSGANSTLMIGENLAHNDWIEILTNQGIMGVLIYAVYWIAFGLFLFKKSKIDNTLQTALGSLFIIYFMKTFFSMSYADIAFSASPIFGYCFAKTYQKQKDNEDLCYIPEFSE